MKSLTWLLVCVSPAVVVGSPIERRVVKERAVTVTQAQLSSFEFYAQWAGAAYCNSDASPGAKVTCSDNVCPDVEADGPTIVGSLPNNTTTGIEGFVAVDTVSEQIVVSFRGSDSVRNWIANFLFAQVACDIVTGCLVHDGFLSAWDEVRDDVFTYVTSAAAAYPSYSLVVTGHSLGGAVGTLAAAYLRAAGHACDLYTYGSPRVGNEEFVDFVIAQAGAEYRVTHTDDPVPRLPPILLNYRHTSPEYWVTTESTSSVSTADIQVCEGTANVDCNAGTTGLDISAHQSYFTNISACGSDTTQFRRREGEVSDEDLEERLNMFARLDAGYAAALAEANAAT